MPKTPSELHKLFLEARDLIKEHGWVRLKAGSFEEGFCLVGAVVRAAKPGNTVEGVGAEAYDLLRRLTDHEHPHEWNDTKGRTEDEVLDLLETAVEATK